ncbi:Ankyrin Repeat Protein [Seminavis robusta]|uniref:Ankyrin Repeat Protein n=1 Tax=Seminavis robusta TaxID=568900 RepID=A0A9N8HIM1_9STRA|nr:Ankyrin Repeat Protein [Seminavis robusta]|eukprot:Sro508_g156910.1 Ankyrin Repeat Protein (390) ;mRNA; f:56773-57942
MMNAANFAPPEWDAILTASMRNDFGAIKRLVQQDGVDPSHSNAVNQSGLHIAALWGNVEAVDALIEYKAAVNAQNKLTGATPLHCAVQSNKGKATERFECIELLIKEGGADVSLADFFGKTPSEYCQENPALAALLTPQAPPLFTAIQEGKVEDVQQIVTAANDTDKKNLLEQVFRGKTPFQITIDLLLQDNDDDETETTTPVDKTQLVSILELLLQAGANADGSAPHDDFANAVNPMLTLEEGPVLPPLVRVCTALQTAYKNPQPDTVALLERTAQLLLLSQETKTTPELEQLLHTACRKGDLQFTKYMVETIGVPPNAKGRQGMTALQFAARSGKTDIVRYLLSDHVNADVSIPDDRGKTALDAARVNNKQDIVALLEEFAAAKQQV